jgi:4'-phosphopantetheinyl transferase
MPLELFETGENRAWALWRIEESEQELQELTSFQEEIPSTITNSQKRMEWLAGRLLTRTLLENFGLTYGGITKDEHGKPFAADVEAHISLTHSYPYAGAIADRHEVVGIDLEQPKDKLLRIASRVLQADELADAGKDVSKHCVYWCAKETLIKIYGKKDLTLAENLRIEPFSLEREGKIVGRIIVKDSERVIPLTYKLFDRFVVVFNSERL